VMSPRPVPAGLPLAGGSELGGRLAALRRGMTARRLPLVWVVLACVVVAGVASLLSALIIARAGTGRTVMTEFGKVSPAVARAMDRKVTLVPPYPASHDGARTDMISVQYAVIVLSDQVGLGFRWNASYPGAYPGTAALVRPEIRNVPWREAVRQVIEPVGLDFEIRDGGVVLRPALAAGSAHPLNP
jgi:hypothetical protein